ncbi:MAG: putative bifunctional diguanylate cyclase/phosphodiesterase [Solirubrobacteraceae bacterium]
MNQLSDMTSQLSERSAAHTGKRVRRRGLLFRSLFMHAPSAMLVIDRDGVIAIANLEARAMFGFGSGDPAGLPVGELVIGLPEVSRDWYRALPSSRLTGTPAAIRELELLARHHGGDEFPVDVALTPLVTDGGVFLSVALRDATERKLSAEALARQAHRDPLTGLPNRVLFLERLEQALARARRSGLPLAVVFLDLDDFKLVNDSLGHDQGDLLLRKLTPRLIAAVRGGDTVARLGGDEFVALCEDLSGDTDAIALAQRITDSVAAPVRLGGTLHTVSVSTGVVMVREPQQMSAQVLLRDADAAMYSAKGNGKGRVAVFDETMRVRLQERVAIENDLRRAVREGELRLFYQPVLELEPERVIAAEALVRWQHRERGLLLPAEFIPVAERAGLLVQIGEWVISEACRQAALWRDRFPDRRLPVSVNVSGGQLRRPGLARFIKGVLAETGLEASLLQLEVTESVLREHEDIAREELLELKSLGVQLIVDDFGAGYTSLVSLRGLRVDGLKLDRTLVHALDRGGDEAAIVKAILTLAGALDAEVTAEGVETLAQVAALHTHGCGRVQGYLFARPAPADELTALVIAEQAGRGPGVLVSILGAVA